VKFLSKLAQIGKVAGQLVGIFAPTIQMAFPGTGAVVGKILDISGKFNEIIIQVELGASALTTPLPGAVKLQLAIPAFSEAILSSAGIAGKKIADPILYRQGVEKVASGWADILNSLDDGEVGKLLKS
jgi:hypothetical protein